MSPDKAINPLYARHAVHPLYILYANRLPVAQRFLKAQNATEACEFFNDMREPDGAIHPDYFRHKNALLHESVALNQFAINDMMAFE